MRYSIPRNTIPASRKSEWKARFAQIVNAAVQAIAERATRFFGE
jgi:hypothetical protein